MPLIDRHTELLERLTDLQRTINNSFLDEPTKIKKITVPLSWQMYRMMASDIEFNYVLHEFILGDSNVSKDVDGKAGYLKWNNKRGQLIDSFLKSTQWSEQNIPHKIGFIPSEFMTMYIVQLLKDSHNKNIKIFNALVKKSKEEGLDISGLDIDEHTFA